MYPEWDLDEPLTLKEACSSLGDRIKPATLRAAHARDELEFERLGNKDFVTPRELKKWRALCRGKGKGRDSICEERGETMPNGLATSPIGSSETERVRLARAAAMATAKRLSGFSPTT